MVLLLAIAGLACAPLLHGAAVRASERGGWAHGGMRAFDAWMAVVAAGVVLLEVVPDGIAHLGVAAVAVALVGAVVANAVHHGTGERWVGMAALAGLAAHSLLDGVAIGVGGAATAGVGIAVALHNLPAGVAIWRAGGRNAPAVLGTAALATAVGGALARFGLHGTSGFDALAPALSALQCFVAGSILHIVTHAHAPPTVAEPRSTAAWTAGGVLVGVLTVAVVIVENPAQEPFPTELGALPAALALWLRGAPWLFPGVVLVGIAARWLRPRPADLHTVLGLFAAAAWVGPGLVLVQAVAAAPALWRSAHRRGDAAEPGDDAVALSGAWLLAGVLAASLAEPWVAADLARIPLATQLLTAGLLHAALASPLALAPLAAVLIHKGAAPAVAVVLTVPPLLARSYGAWMTPGLRTAAAVAAAVGLAAVLPGGLFRWPEVPDLHASAEAVHSVVEYAAALGLALALGFLLARSGTRARVAPTPPR